MRKIQVFDPALCCSSGVCGTDVDQVLVTFSADIEWLKQQGASLQRYNLAQQPLVFAQTPVVANFLDISGVEGLPLTLVNEQIVLTGRYPTRVELIRYAGLSSDLSAENNVSTPANSQNNADRKITVKGIIKCGCSSSNKGGC
ncbi:MAG: arsenite efflux transporter metallochaperone ArsD [Enterovibrio sp.]